MGRKKKKKVKRICMRCDKEVLLSPEFYTCEACRRKNKRIETYGAVI